MAKSVVGILGEIDRKLAGMGSDIEYLKEGRKENREDHGKMFCGIDAHGRSIAGLKAWNKVFIILFGALTAAVVASII